MLFCSAPMQTNTVQRTNAPVVPSAPIEKQSAAIRNPGLASATTKPSHQVIALSSWRSSTSACAIGGLLFLVGRPNTRPRTGSAALLAEKYLFVQLDSRPVLRLAIRPGSRDPRSHGHPRPRSQRHHRGRPRRRWLQPAQSCSGRSPCRIDPAAERVAISAALEAGSPLLVTNVVWLPNYPTTLMLAGPDAATLPHRGGPRGGARRPPSAPPHSGSAPSICGSAASARSRRCSRSSASTGPACSCSAPTPR